MALGLGAAASGLETTTAGGWSLSAAAHAGLETCGEASAAARRDGVEVGGAEGTRVITRREAAESGPMFGMLGEGAIETMESTPSHVRVEVERVDKTASVVSTGGGRWAPTLRECDDSASRIF